MLQNNKIIIFSILNVFVFFASAQKDAKNVYEGNKAYFSGKHNDAVERYREAIKLNPNNQKAYFNLGNALYKNALEVKSSKQQFFQAGKKVSSDSLGNLILDEAAQNFANVANTISNKDTLHQAWHNIGNCYLQKKDYSQAVTAYKKSLKFNPKDEDTRYNLAYALKHMPKDKKGGGSQNQNKDQNKKEENKDGKQQQQNQISKDEAERLLKAMMNAEKKNQEKRKQQQDDASKSNPEKDW